MVIVDGITVEYIMVIVDGITVEYFPENSGKTGIGKLTDEQILEIRRYSDNNKKSAKW